MTIKMTGTPEEIADFMRNLTEQPLTEITSELYLDEEDDYND